MEPYFVPGIALALAGIQFQSDTDSDIVWLPAHAGTTELGSPPAISPTLGWPPAQEPCWISAKNQVRRSLSSIHTSIKLAVATSL